MNEETKNQIDLFLEELRVILKDQPEMSDFSPLYAKYPLVRIGIRRAIMYLQKQA